MEDFQIHGRFSLNRTNNSLQTATRRLVEDMSRRWMFAVNPFHVVPTAATNSECVYINILSVKCYYKKEVCGGLTTSETYKLEVEYESWAWTIETPLSSGDAND